MRRKKSFRILGVCLLLTLGMLTGCESKENTTKEATATQEKASVAKGDATATPKEVVNDSMVPIEGSKVKDGTYDVKVDSSSAMFRITQAKLRVKNGTMQAVMTMGGTGYECVYMGTGEEAINADKKAYIPYEELSSGKHTFTIPVEALDKGIACAALSKKKQQWYDRTLVFLSTSLPDNAIVGKEKKTIESLGLSDGIYEAKVSLEGGSGRASVQSPVKVSVKDKKAYATIVWSSSNYDYMKVDGKKYLNENKDSKGNSTFTIPVAAFEEKIPVVGDTTAMSTPHEIDYTLCFELENLEK